MRDFCVAVAALIPLLLVTLAIEFRTVAQYQIDLRHRERGSTSIRMAGRQFVRVSRFYLYAGLVVEVMILVVTPLCPKVLQTSCGSWPLQAVQF